MSLDHLPGRERLRGQILNPDLPCLQDVECKSHSQPHEISQRNPLFPVPSPFLRTFPQAQSLDLAFLHPALIGMYRLANGPASVSN